MKEVFLSCNCFQDCMSIAVKSQQTVLGGCLVQGMLTMHLRSYTVTQNKRSEQFICLFCIVTASLVVFSFSQVLPSLSSTEPPEMPLVLAVVILFTEGGKKRYV